MARFQVKTDANGRKYWDDFFVYSTSPVALATAGSQASQQINIEANSDFIWSSSCFFADISGAAQTDSTRVIPLIGVSITDSGSGRNLFNRESPLSAIAGYGSLPFVLPIERFFEANSNITVTFTNNSAGTAYANVQLSLIGIKRFYGG